MPEGLFRQPRTVRRAIVAMVVLGALSGLLDLADVALGGGEDPYDSIVVGFLLAVVPAPLLVALVLSRDRYEPEPPRMLALTFFWGATVAAFLAGVLNAIGAEAVAGFFDEAAGEVYGASISAPVVEEFLKATALLLVLRIDRNEFNGVVDAVVYAGMVGLGFAMAENISYYAFGHAEGFLAATVIVRGVLSPFTHPLFTSLTGIGLAYSLRKRRRYPFVIGLLGAMLLHSIWNTITGGSFLLVYLFVFVPGFLLLIRFVRREAAEEAAAVRRHLAPEVASGVLTTEEVECLASVPARRQAVRQARKEGGPQGRRSARRLHHAAIELAFLRRQAEEFGPPPGERELEHRHLREIRAAREELGPASVGP